MTIRVLVVDEKELMRKLCETVLKQLGCEVTCVSTPDEALDRVSIGFDWVLSDVHSPGKSGLWLAQQLRKLYPHLKVVLMSGNASDERIRKQAQGMGLSLLAKPFEIEQLVGIIRKPATNAVVA